MIGGPFVIFVDGKRSRSIPWFGPRKPYGVAEQLADAGGPWTEVSYVGPTVSVVLMDDGTVMGLNEAIRAGYIRRIERIRQAVGRKAY